MLKQKGQENSRAWWKFRGVRRNNSGLVPAAREPGPCDRLLIILINTTERTEAGFADSVVSVFSVVKIPKVKGDSGSGAAGNNLHDAVEPRVVRVRGGEIRYPYGRMRRQNKQGKSGSAASESLNAL